MHGPEDTQTGGVHHWALRIFLAAELCPRESQVCTDVHPSAMPAWCQMCAPTQVCCTLPDVHPGQFQMCVYLLTEDLQMCGQM